MALWESPVAGSRILGYEAGEARFIPQNTEFLTAVPKNRWNSLPGINFLCYNPLKS